MEGGRLRAGLGSTVFESMWLLSRKDADVLKCRQTSQEENGDHVKAKQRGRLLRRDTPGKLLAWKFGLRIVLRETGVVSDPVSTRCTWR